MPNQEFFATHEAAQEEGSEIRMKSITEMDSREMTIHQGQSRTKPLVKQTSSNKWKTSSPYEVQKYANPKPKASKALKVLKNERKKNKSEPTVLETTTGYTASHLKTYTSDIATRDVKTTPSTRTLGNLMAG